MLPDTGGLLSQDFKIVQQPSKTYLMENGRIKGVTDGLEAVKQAVYCILNTERYDFVIYSWNYGTELKGLFGKSMSYVKSELKRRVREALTQDKRIKSVDGFAFEPSGNVLKARFTVHTIYGDFDAGKEVKI